MIHVLNTCMFTAMVHAGGTCYCNVDTSVEGMEGTFSVGEFKLMHAKVVVMRGSISFNFVFTIWEQFDLPKSTSSNLVAMHVN